jgi:hypothetical protein
MRLAVGIDKGNVVVVLGVVVKSCNAKKYIPVTQIKRYFEKNNLVCRGNYSRTKGGNVGSLKSGVACGRRSGDDRVGVLGESSGHAKLDRDSLAVRGLPRLGKRRW